MDLWEESWVGSVGGSVGWKCWRSLVKKKERKGSLKWCRTGFASAGNSVVFVGVFTAFYIFLFVSSR